jgi:hypothetical protein
VVHEIGEAMRGSAADPDRLLERLERKARA